MVRGDDEEREFVEIARGRGWIAGRMAGSGIVQRTGQILIPFDVIALRGVVTLVVEVKGTRGNAFYPKNNAQTTAQCAALITLLEQKHDVWYAVCFKGRLKPGQSRWEMFRPPIDMKPLRRGEGVGVEKILE